MRFDMNKFQQGCFEDHVVRQGKNYDYVWCISDVNVHRHVDFYEVLFLAGGPAYHYYQGQEQIISRNTIYLFAPGEAHGIYKTTPESCHFSFFMTKEFMEQFFMENPMLRSVLRGKKHLTCELSDVEHEYIYKLISVLVNQDNEWHKVSMFLYNIISLLRLHNEAEQNETKNDYVMDLVEKLNNYTYLTHKVHDIYNYYPIARCILIREFKKYTGMTIVQYQRKQKMVYASQLLSNSDYSISEIANILKFESISHFWRIFKESYGITPNEYRKVRTEKKYKKT